MNGGFLSSRRSRLTALLLAISLGGTVVVLSAAGDTMSYYVTPEEFSQQLDTSGNRWRVGGRVIEGTVVEDGGRPVQFAIEGDRGERMNISYPAGPTPSLFGPKAFVIVEGEAEGAGTLRASSVIIKHEDEFLRETPAAAGIRP